MRTKVTSAEAHADLANSRKALLAPLAGLSEEQFRFAPPGAWSIAVHLAHVLRVERGVGEGIARALSEQSARMASAGASNDRDEGLARHLAVPQILHGLQASRRSLEALLDEPLPQSPEAMWHLEVEDFMAVVTMDSKGQSLHAEIESSSAARLAEIIH